MPFHPSPAGEALDLPAYLDRIGLSEEPPCSLQGLAVLVRAHRMAIPFENIDILLGRGVNLVPDAIFDKLVHRRRGGYCFEQNALFERVLRRLGFDARPLMARVWLRVAGDEVPPRTHQLVHVMIDGAPWIVDAGFGGSLTPPLPLIPGEAQEPGGGVAFRLRKDEAQGWFLDRRGIPSFMEVDATEASQWQPQYCFTTQAVFPEDLEMGNHWTATRQGTRFTSGMIVHRITESGYVSLLDNRFKRVDGADQEVRMVTTARDLQELLSRYFGIALSLTESEHLFTH